MPRKVQKLRFEIEGKVQGKKNNYRVSKSGGFYKAKGIKRLEEYIQWIIVQAMLEQNWKMIASEPIHIGLVAVMKRWNGGDLDNIQQTIQDVLEKIAFKNDMWVASTNTMKIVNKDEPEHVKVVVYKSIYDHTKVIDAA